MTAPDTLLAFAGHWNISREIDDQHAGQKGEFTGECTLVPDAQGLVYHETGHLILGGGPSLAAMRRYFWRDHGKRVEIHFEDGRPFHHMELGREHVIAEHACDPDFYAVEYAFARWPEWRSVWTVSGPRKRYVMTSVYSRW